MYNAFEKIKGIIYCSKCVPKEAAIIINTAKLEFAEFEKAMKEAGTIVVNEEPRICKYCGARNSSDWKYLPLTNEWCCKRRGCRKKAREE